MLWLPEHIADRALSMMTQSAPAYPPDEAAKYGLCSISGLPARFKDPQTGQRYGSLAAFKQLRAAGSGSGAIDPAASTLPVG